MAQKVGIFAVDPGGTTGIAWGIFDLEKGTIRDCLREREDAGSESLAGSPEEQIYPLAKRWMAFYNFCYSKRWLPASDVDLVIEDWIVRPKRPVMTGHTPVLPVMIAWGLVGYRMGARDEYERNYRGPTVPLRVVWQQPANAMTLATSKRLRDWDCWVRGKPHEREAWAHVALRLANLLKT